MTENRMIKYFIYVMIGLAAVFHYAAYVIGAMLFITFIIKDAKSITSIFIKQKAILLIMAALALATMFSEAVGASLLTDGLILLNVIIYMVMVKWVDKGNIHEVLKFLNIMGIMICVYGLYQYVTGDLNVSKSWTDETMYGSLTRIYSSLRNPNIFAAYLTFNLCFAVACCLRKKADAALTINIVLSSICLILTYSRGGFIAFTAAMLVIVMVSREIKILAYLGIMISMFFGYNFLKATNRAVISTIAIDSSSLYRMEIWKASWALFKGNIAFGEGPGSVAKLLSYSSEKLKGYIFHAHNIPLHILAETGIFGMAAFAALVMTWLKSCQQFLTQKNNEYSYLALGFVAALTAMLVHGLVDCAVLIPSRSLVFVIYLALFPALYLKESSKEG